MWSKVGDIMSRESLDIAQAAYEAYDPSLGCKEIHRDLCFIIKRAQSPMQMQASPFPPFNLINYAAVSLFFKLEIRININSILF